MQFKLEKIIRQSIHRLNPERGSDELWKISNSFKRSNSELLIESNKTSVIKESFISSKISDDQVKLTETANGHDRSKPGTQEPKCETRL